MKKRALSSDTVISISAIIVAFVSIIIAVWQGLETRRHNRLSVQPHLEATFSLDYEQGSMQYVIKNNGLGPAVVGNIFISVGSKKYKVNEPQQLFEMLSSVNIENIPVTYEVLEKGSIIIPKEIKTIFSINFSDLEELDVDPKKIPEKMNLLVNYKSMYDEKFELSN